MMTECDGRKKRHDPYNDFKFRMKWHGRTVAGFHQAAALPRERTRYEPVTLERGVTHDVEFEQWAARGSMEPKAPPTDIVIGVYDEAGQLALAYKFFHCRTSSYQALPELDANSNALAIEAITLQHEGWERV
jgi:phage tail-like protein